MGPARNGKETTIDSNLVNVYGFAYVVNLEKLVSVMKGIKVGDRIPRTPMVKKNGRLYLIDIPDSDSRLEGAEDEEVPYSVDGGHARTLAYHIIRWSQPIVELSEDAIPVGGSIPAGLLDRIKIQKIFIDPNPEEFERLRKASNDPYQDIKPNEMVKYCKQIIDAGVRFNTGCPYV